MTSTLSRGLAGYLAAARARVDAVLARWATDAQPAELWPHAVAGAMRYSLLGGGKRLRPTLVVAAYEAVGGSVAAIAELAAAVEVVHAYSLVHDDLPCMDDDDLRRGRPTTHRAFDVATATRAGFHMVALAAAVLAHGMEALGLDPSRRRAVALELFGAAGAGGMIGGQVLDLAAEGLALPAERLEEVHRRKTGALIAAACVIGGLAAGAPTRITEALRGYGARVGLAFQIYDDVLDATATSDNPRTENPESILDEVEAGMRAKPHHREVDRREAIALALKLARPGDTILLAGKGHETYQVIGTEKQPFDERRVVRELGAA